MEQKELHLGRAVRITQDYMGEYKGKIGAFVHLDTSHEDGDWYGIEFPDNPRTIVYFRDREFDVVWAPAKRYNGKPDVLETAAERYNREMDERLHIQLENREKPWLPIQPGQEDW